MCEGVVPWGLTTGAAFITPRTKYNQALKCNNFSIIVSMTHFYYQCQQTLIEISNTSATTFYHKIITSGRLFLKRVLYLPFSLSSPEHNHENCWCHVCVRWYLRHEAGSVLPPFITWDLELRRPILSFTDPSHSYTAPSQVRIGSFYYGLMKIWSTIPLKLKSKPW